MDMYTGSRGNREDEGAAVGIDAPGRLGLATGEILTTRNALKICKYMQLVRLEMFQDITTVGVAFLVSFAR